MNQQVEGRIRIKTIPAGEAPLWVRKAWLGVELQVHTTSTYGGFGVYSKKRAPKGLYYLVNQAEAIEALQKVNGAAAEWWEKSATFKPRRNFAFRSDEAAISGKFEKVVRGKIRPFFGLLEVGVGAHDAFENAG